MADKDYYIMSGDTTVAKWKNNELPLYLKHVRNADMWLETRAIDSHRANSRLLKKHLGSEKRTILVPCCLSTPQLSQTIIGLSRLTAN